MASVAAEIDLVNVNQTSNVNFGASNKASNKTATNKAIHVYGRHARPTSEPGRRKASRAETERETARPTSEPAQGREPERGG